MSELELTAKITGGIATGGEPKSIVEITYKQRSSFLLVVAASDAPAIVARIEGKQPTGRMVPETALNAVLQERDRLQAENKRLLERSQTYFGEAATLSEENAKTEAENERLKETVRLWRDLAGEEEALAPAEEKAGG